MKGFSKMLRSALSLVLALSLVIGLCPAVFATEIPTDDLSNIDWTSDLSDYNWDNVAWDKVDMSQIDYDKVAYDKIDYDAINYEQIDWGKVNYDKVDYEAINYDKIDYSTLDYAQVDYDKLAYDKIDYESIDYAQLDYEKLDYEKLDYENVAYDKIDYAQVNYEKLDYEKLDYEKVDYENIDYAQVDYEKLDYEKLAYDKIDYSKLDYENIDYGKIDYDKVDYDKIDWDSVDISKVPLEEVPLDKVDLNKIPVSKNDVMANLSLTQLASMVRKNPSTAYSMVHDLLENKGYIDATVNALNGLENAIDTAAAKAEAAGAPAALGTALKNAKTAIAKMRELLKQDTISRSDLLSVYEDLRTNVLTVVEFVADKTPDSVAVVIKDVAGATYLAWEIFLDYRVPAYLELIVTSTKNFATENQNAILLAGKALAKVLVDNADVLDPILPEGIKANALEIVELLKAGQERKAASVAMQIVRDTIQAANEAGVNKELAVELIEKAKDLAVAVKDAVYARYIEATHDYYTVSYGSHYVALGDASVVENSYANLIAQELHMHYTNLGDENLKTVGETFNTIAANAATIASADLITIGFDNNTFALNALNQNVAFDWAGNIGEAAANAVAVALNDIKNYLVNDLAVSEEEALKVVGAIEAYAYSAGSYAWNMPQLVQAIREINEDAVVVLVGMYNPLENMTVQIKGKTLELGRYLDYLVDVVGIEGLTYAMLTLDCIYVDAPAVETEYEAAGKSTVLDAVAMFEYIANQGAEMRASDAGDEYIKTQILNALTIDYDGIYRLYGDTRFETAIKVAEEMKYLNNVEKFETMIITSGEKFPDALAGTYLATTMNAPILLSYLNDFTADRYYDNQTADYVAANLAENGTVYILGGDKAVSAEMEEMLTSRGVKAECIERLAGNNRFETNLAILNELGVDGQEILVCTGTVFADTLAASATGLPILLVYNEKGELYDYQEEFLNGLNGNAVTILGGNAAVSDELQADIAAAAGVEVARVYGDTRIETSIAVANKYFPDATQMVLATGWEFADALAGGSMANTLDAPIILTMGPVSATGYEFSKNWNYGASIYNNFVAPNGIKMGVILGGYAEKCIPDVLAKASFGLPADAYIFVK